MNGMQINSQLQADALSNSLPNGIYLTRVKYMPICKRYVKVLDGIARVMTNDPFFVSSGAKGHLFSLPSFFEVNEIIKKI